MPSLAQMGPAVDRSKVEFVLDEEPVEAWVEPNQTLLEVLRTVLGHTDVKYGCGEGVCGTCTVLFDGDPVSSCLVFAVQADGHVVTTPRGAGPPDEIAALRAAFLAAGAAQCGFCTPAMLLTVHHLLAENRAAGREDVRSGISGNLCRCTGYTKILDAVEDYQAGRRNGSGSA